MDSTAPKWANKNVKKIYSVLLNKMSFIVRELRNVNGYLGIKRSSQEKDYISK